jgi:hypothetical protein
LTTDTATTSSPKMAADAPALVMKKLSYWPTATHPIGHRRLPCRGVPDRREVRPGDRQDALSSPGRPAWLREIAGYREHAHLAPLYVIPEGVGPCQRGFCWGFGCVRACVTGVSCFPGSCPCLWRAAGRVKDRAEPGRQGRRRRRP